MLAYLLLQGSVIRLSISNRDTLAKAVDEFRQKIGRGVGEPTFDTAVAGFADLTPEVTLFPTREQFEVEIEQKMRVEPASISKKSGPVLRSSHCKVRRRWMPSATPRSASVCLA